MAQQQLADRDQGKELGVNAQCLRLLLELFENLPRTSCVEEWSFDLTELDKSAALEEEPLLTTFSLQSNRHVRMWWIVTNIVKPQTASRQIRFLVLFLAFVYFDAVLVAPVTDFHSYTWSERCSDTLGTLLSALPVSMKDEPDDSETRYLWFDIFCQNQHVVEDVSLTFSRAISQISRLLFSLPHIDKPQALGRVWCLFEVMTAYATPTCEFRLISDKHATVKAGENPMLYFCQGRKAIDERLCTEFQARLSAIHSDLQREPAIWIV